MKILTGATGVLGSHIMYEILELFINTKIDGKLFIITKQRKKKTLKIA
jgi:thioester reductase-like protein